MTSQWRHRNRTHSWYSELNFLQNVYAEFSFHIWEINRMTLFCNLFIGWASYFSKQPKWTEWNWTELSLLSTLCEMNWNELNCTTTRQFSSVQFSSVCSLSTVLAMQLNWHFSSVQFCRLDATELNRFQLILVQFSGFVHAFRLPHSWSFYRCSASSLFDETCVDDRQRLGGRRQRASAEEKSDAASHTWPTQSAGERTGTRLAQ